VQVSFLQASFLVQQPDFLFDADDMFDTVYASPVLITVTAKSSVFKREEL